MYMPAEIQHTLGEAPEICYRANDGLSVIANNWLQDAGHTKCIETYGEPELISFNLHGSLSVSYPDNSVVVGYAETELPDHVASGFGVANPELWNGHGIKFFADGTKSLKVYATDVYPHPVPNFLVATHHVVREVSCHYSNSNPDIAKVMDVYVETSQPKTFLSQCGFPADQVNGIPLMPLRNGNCILGITYEPESMRLLRAKTYHYPDQPANYSDV